MVVTVHITKEAASIIGAALPRHIGIKTAIDTLTNGGYMAAVTGGADTVAVLKRIPGVTVFPSNRAMWNNALDPTHVLHFEALGVHHSGMHQTGIKKGAAVTYYDAHALLFAKHYIPEFDPDHAL